jgi:uncharacterized membrane protein YfhO
VNRGILFVVSVILAAGASAFLLLPTYKIIQSSSMVKRDISITMEWLYEWQNLFSKTLHGSFDSIVNGMPNIFGGLFSLLLFPMFFISKKIQLREKILFLIFMIVLLVSFQVPFINLAWHGFEEPTWFPYRYSFLFSFLMIYLAARAFNLLNKWSLIPLTVLFVLNIYGILSVTSELSNIDTTINLFLISLIFVLVVCRVMFKSVQKVITFSLILVVCFDMTYNAWTLMNKLNDDLGYYTKADYNKLDPDYETVVEELVESDKGFYRMDLRSFRTLNDPLRYGYKGIPHFSSLADTELHIALSKLGYTSTNDLWISNSGSTLVTNALFGVKYAVTDKINNTYGFNKIDQIGKVSAYINENALPIGFMISENVELQNLNSFELQNQLLSMDSMRYFSMIYPSSVNYRNINVIDKSNKIRFVKNDKTKEGYLSYTFDLIGKQQLYLSMELEKSLTAKIYVNGKLLGDFGGAYNNGIFNLGKYSDEAVTVLISVDKSEIVTENIMFYQLDIEKFKNRIEELKEQGIRITDWSGREIKGTLSTPNDGILYFSIPHDEGWKVEIDGSVVPVKKVFDAFLGVPISEGDHSVVLKYTPPGFNEGVGISLISILLLLSLYWREHKRRIRN